MGVNPTFMCPKSTLWNLNECRRLVKQVDEPKSQIYLVEFKRLWGHGWGWGCSQSQIYLVEFKPRMRPHLVQHPAGSQIYLVEFKPSTPYIDALVANRPKSTLWNLNV